jgi:hypothetical protein
MARFHPAGEIKNHCPECRDKNRPGERFYACGSCFGSRRDQAHCIDDTIQVSNRSGRDVVVIPAAAPGPVDLDAARAGFMAASLERDKKKRTLLVYQLVLLLPRALDEIGESRVELGELRRELEELRAEHGMLLSIARVRASQTKEIQEGGAPS